MARVLIVDDDERIRRLLRMIVEREGHDAAESASADDALAYLQSHQADVVFADIRMPGKGGDWMSAEIRRRHPATAVVLATGVTDVEPSLSLQAGVVAYLVKPFDAAAVQRAIEKALRWQKRSSEAPAASSDELDRWLDSVEQD